MSAPINSTAEIVNSIGFNFKDFMYLAGVCISTLSAGVAWASARRTLKRDLNSLGDSEIKIFELIAKAETELLKFNLNIKKIQHDAGADYKLGRTERIELNFLIESLLNAYDIACQRFIDEKLDKDRFKKTYKMRLHKLCANPLYQPFFNINNYQYIAIIKANQIMNDPESSVS